MRRALVGFVTLAVLSLVVLLTTGAAARPWLPAGYWPLNGEVGYRWTTGSCAAQDPGGCWHAVFITRAGCSAGLSATLSELREGAVVGDVLASVPPIAARTPVEVEFDADAAAPLSGSIVQASCA